MGERELLAILQRRWAESVFWDSPSEAPDLVRETELAEGILGFWSICPSILLSQSRVRWGYKLTRYVHLWFSRTGRPSSNEQVETALTVRVILAVAFISRSIIDSCISRGPAGWATCTWTGSVLMDNHLCALRPLIQRLRKHDENEANYNIQCTTAWDTDASVVYLSLWRRAWAGMIHS